MTEEPGGAFAPEVKWAPITVVLRGLICALAGAGIIWWAPSAPADGAAQGIFYGTGVAFVVIGLAMTGWGLLRAIRERSPGA